MPYVILNRAHDVTKFSKWWPMFKFFWSVEQKKKTAMSRSGEDFTKIWYVTFRLFSYNVILWTNLLLQVTLNTINKCFVKFSFSKIEGFRPSGVLDKYQNLSKNTKNRASDFHFKIQ